LLQSSIRTQQRRQSYAPIDALQVLCYSSRTERAASAASTLVNGRLGDNMSDPRVFFAAERTLLAWIRTGLTVMGFGFVVARFGLFLDLLAASACRRPLRLRRRRISQSALEWLLYCSALHP